jgi:hypothetical protein
VIIENIYGMDRLRVIIASNSVVKSPSSKIIHGRKILYIFTEGGSKIVFIALSFHRRTVSRSNDLVASKKFLQQFLS